MDRNMCEVAYDLPLPGFEKLCLNDENTNIPHQHTTPASPEVRSWEDPEPLAEHSAAMGCRAQRNDVARPTPVALSRSRPASGLEPSPQAPKPRAKKTDEEKRLAKNAYQREHYKNPEVKARRKAADKEKRDRAKAIKQLEEAEVKSAKIKSMKIFNKDRNGSG
jgi:hypothetical protein